MFPPFENRKGWGSLSWVMQAWKGWASLRLRRSSLRELLSAQDDRLLVVKKDARLLDLFYFNDSYPLARFTVDVNQTAA